MRTLAIFYFLWVFLYTGCITEEKDTVDQPNILWITVEDMSPNLGCYGDADAHTPNLDQLAARGVTYSNAFATAPVCAPARSTIITGMYAYSIGSQHMRCTGRFPGSFGYYPQYLREAGYYCTNNSKEDYNLEYDPGAIWDDSGPTAHWRNRSTSGQPFFAIFNINTTHESHVNGEKKYLDGVSKVPRDLLADPKQLHLPPYYPDTPVVRELWSRYYNNITAMDLEVGELLTQLENDGLAGNTIVFFYSDHGAGVPMYKRWLFDSGLKVPLLVYVPPDYQHLTQREMGTMTDELVSFVDLAPTALNLAGIEIPGNMQGRAFLGKDLHQERKYIHAGRDRMDERYDMQRIVRDKQYKYIRYYEAYKPYVQYMNTPEQGDIMKEIRKASNSGALPEPGAALMVNTKPFEALYDLDNDPYELNNLAGKSTFNDKLIELRTAHEDWTDSIRDTGLIPETIIRQMEEDNDMPIYSIMRNKNIPIADVRKMAFTRDPDLLVAGLDHDAAAVRYWALIGLGNLNATTATPNISGQLNRIIDDPIPVVRIALARLFCRVGRLQEGLMILGRELKSQDQWVRLAAAQVLDEIGDDARPAIDDLRDVMDDQNKYVVRIANHALNQMLGTNNMVK